MRIQRITCTKADVGVLVVHGIGNQEEDHTKNKYGQAIAEVWDHFGGSHNGFNQIRCSSGHIHLTRPDGSHAAVITEGRWNQVDPEPPSIHKLLVWLLVVTPWVLMYTALRPIRWNTQAAGIGAITSVLWGLTIWFLRFVLIPLLLPVLLLVVIVAVVILGLAHHGVSRLIVTPTTGLATLPTRLLGMAGDAFRFSQAMHSADKYADVVAGEAAQLAQLSKRLLVVAHSQGGAVTYEAIANLSPTGHFGRATLWPSVPTQVFTLGSGHNRLMMLRRMTRSTAMRIVTGLGAAVIVASSSIGFHAQVTGTGDSDLYGYSAYGTAALAGLTLGVFVIKNGREIGKTLRAHSVNWTDIWATRDLVPDGPLPFSGTPSVRVTNTHSFGADHTTYDKNPVQVTARIVDAIDPDRLKHDQPIVRRLHRARCRRYRSASLLRAGLTLGLLTLLQPLSKARVAAEAAGRLSTLAHDAPPWTRFVHFGVSRSTVVHF